MVPIDYNDPNDPWRTPGYDPYKGMSDKQKFLASLGQVIGIVLGTVVAMILCALFGSCTTTKYVPVPEYHTDTLRIVQHQRDSIYLSDSIYVSDFVRGDTVYKTTEQWHTQWRERIVRDTIYQSKRDSIPYPVEVTKEVPAKLTPWQQFRIHLANILLYLILIVGIIYVGKKHIKRLRGE